MKKLFFTFLLFFVLINFTFSNQIQNGKNEIQNEIQFIQFQLFENGANQNEVEANIKKGKLNHSTKALCALLEKSKNYRAYIRKKIIEYELPSCLEFLPIIESDYNPVAKPKNGVSMGMWQFMPNSVAPYLELNEEVDDRKDVWRSTDAALKKLRDNYKMFDDWLLALAAYNCGAGAVRRALEKVETKNFSTIAKEKLIPNHAIVYVPNFLRVADFIENALFYNEQEIYNAAFIEGFLVDENIFDKNEFVKNEIDKNDANDFIKNNSVENDSAEKNKINDSNKNSSVENDSIEKNNLDEENKKNKIKNLVDKNNSSITLKWKIDKNFYFFYDDFDYVTVNDSINLKELSNELCIDFQILKTLNLRFTNSITPENKNYQIRLPAQTKLAALFALNSLKIKKEKLKAQNNE